MPLAEYSPPGFLDDLSAAGRQNWSQWINSRIQKSQQGYPDNFEYDAPRSQFFNLLDVDLAGDQATKTVTWTAFPRQVRIRSVSDRMRWRDADSSRSLQDEYCEWSVDRDPGSGKIIRVIFTCEGPEYWQELAKDSPEKVLALYQEFINPDVKYEHIFNSDGTYNPLNRWNNSTVRGAMHLIQRNNTLGAEIELAAGATIPREINGQLLTGERELIECGQYGAVERNSDPTIGAEVNELARLGAQITLQDPVGLYFDDLHVTASWKTPDGTDPKSFWKFVRGTDGHFVRAVYEVPASRNYTVGDIEIDRRPIEYGSQIADFIQIKLTGVAHRFGQSFEAMTSCRRPRSTGFGTAPTDSGLEGVILPPDQRPLTEKSPIRLRADGAKTGAVMQLINWKGNEKFEDMIANSLKIRTLDQRFSFDEALLQTRDEIAITWSEIAAGSMDLHEQLDSQHFRMDENLIKDLQNSYRDSPIGELPVIPVNTMSIDRVEDGLKKVPLISCLRSHLPVGRDPTEEELRDAFQKCIG